MAKAALLLVAVQALALRTTSAPYVMARYPLRRAFAPGSWLASTAPPAAPPRAPPLGLSGDVQLVHGLTHVARQAPPRAPG